MPEFRITTPEEFDAIIKDHFFREEHELLESRFFNKHGQIIAKVVRRLDDIGELAPHADLVVTI